MVTDEDVALVRHIVQRILVPCIVVIGLLGNSVSIYVLTRRRMRCTTNIYLTALAITDIGYLTMSFLASLQHYEYIETHGAVYYRIFGVVMWLTDACAYLSIYIAVCFTIERFIAIRYPLRKQTFCTESLAKKVVGGVAVFCLLSTISTAFEHECGIDIKLIDSHGRPCNATTFQVTQENALLPSSTNVVRETRAIEAAIGADEYFSAETPSPPLLLFLSNSNSNNNNNDAMWHESSRVVGLSIDADGDELEKEMRRQLLHQAHSNGLAERLKRGKSLTSSLTEANGVRTRTRTRTNTNTNIDVDMEMERERGTMMLSTKPSTAMAINKMLSMIVPERQKREAMTSTASNIPGIISELFPQENFDLLLNAENPSNENNKNTNNNNNNVRDHRLGTSQDNSKYFIQNDSLDVNVTEEDVVCMNVTIYKDVPSALADNEMYRKIFFNVTFLVFVFIPLCILATFNCFLVMLVRRSNNLRGEMTNANSIRKSSKHKATTKTSTVSQENRVTITLIAVVLFFIICQLPWAITLILFEHMDDIDINLAKILGNICNFLVAINAAANFFLYCVLSDKYRKTVRELITGYKYRKQRFMDNNNTSLYTTYNGSRRHRSQHTTTSSLIIK